MNTLTALTIRAAAILLTVTLTAWPLPGWATPETFRGQSPESARVEQGVRAGLEEAQLVGLATRWFGTDEASRIRAAGVVATNAQANGWRPRDILFPVASRPRGWWTIDQIDNYWDVFKPKAGTAGGGGTAGVQMPTFESLDIFKDEESYAIVAVDDSGGDAGKRRPWTVVAVGDWRNALLNRLSEPLKDLGSARLNTDYGLSKNPPAKVKQVTADSPFSFREALREIILSSAYRDRVLGDPKGLRVITNLDVLMAVMDRVVLNQADALSEFPELEQRIQQYQQEGRIGPPEVYADYPILKGAVGNLMLHAALLITGAILEPATPGERRRLDPDRVKQAEWLIERALGLSHGHTVLASTEVTERYGVFSRQLPRSQPNDDGEVLIGRIRPWSEAYDPSASKSDRANRQVFAVQGQAGAYTLTYLGDDLQPVASPQWVLGDTFPQADWETLDEAARTGEPVVLQGYPIVKQDIYEVTLGGDLEIQVRNLRQDRWSGRFPGRILAERIRPRLQELRARGWDPVVTMIVGEDNYEEADTWHGTDALRHEVSGSDDVGSWILYHGHEGETEATAEAIALIDNTPPGGIYADRAWERRHLAPGCPHEAGNVGGVTTGRPARGQGDPCPRHRL